MMLGVTWLPPPRYSESKMIVNYRVDYRELALPDAALALLERSPERPLSGADAGADAAHLLHDYDDQNETASRPLNVSSTSTYLTNLKPYTAYVIQVLSTTAFGLGARSTPLLCRTFASSARLLRSVDSLECAPPCANRAALET